MDKNSLGVKQYWIPKSNTCQRNFAKPTYLHHDFLLYNCRQLLTLIIIGIKLDLGLTRKYIQIVRSTHGLPNQSKLIIFIYTTIFLFLTKHSTRANLVKSTELLKTQSGQLYLNILMFYLVQLETQPRSGSQSRVF